MRAWREDLIFRDEVAKDAAITGRLTPEKLARTFDLHRQLANVDAIFDRVIGHHVPVEHAAVPRAAGG
jgi:adenylosuccinate lyase